MDSAEHNALYWRAAATPGHESCRFDFEGRRYVAIRDTATKTLVELAKRERTNRSGVYFVALTLGGSAARKVISAVFPPSSSPLEK